MWTEVSQDETSAVNPPWSTSLRSHCAATIEIHGLSCATRRSCSPESLRRPSACAQRNDNGLKISSLIYEFDRRNELVASGTSDDDADPTDPAALAIQKE